MPSEDLIFKPHLELIYLPREPLIILAIKGTKRLIQALVADFVSLVAFRDELLQLSPQLLQVILRGRLPSAPLKCLCELFSKITDHGL